MPDIADDATITDPFAGTAYRALGRMGAGGMGEIFRVEHRNLGREFVAKILHRYLVEEPRLLERVRVEAQVLGRLDHPNIVSIAGFDRLLDGRPFIVMERLVGRSLAAELAARQRLPLDEAVRFTLELLSALGAAHSIGVVHRDIKPENLFVCREAGKPPFLKVLDFGVARVLPGASDAPAPPLPPTETGMVMGTPRFVSPEGAVGQRVDGRADLYATGLVLFIMIAGRGPFDDVLGNSGVLAAHANEKPPVLSKVAPEPIPHELDDVLARALRKEPSKRFQTADEFAQALVGATGFIGLPVGITTTVDGPAHLPTKRTPVFENDEARLLAEASTVRNEPVMVDSLNLPTISGAPTTDAQRKPAAPRAGPAHRPALLALLFVVVLLSTAAIAALAVGFVRGHGGP